MIDYAELAKLGVATIYEASGKEGLIDIPFHQLIPRSRASGPARTVIERIAPGDIVHAGFAFAAPRRRRSGSLTCR